MVGLALAWLPGWVLGIAWQLQQAALWPGRWYAALLLAGCLLMVWLFWRGSRCGRLAAWPLVLAMVAGAWSGAGLTGVRAAHFASQALDPALQGLDIEVTGRIASMPQRQADGARFELAVVSATRDGRPVRLPPLLQLAWHSRAVAGADGAAPGPNWRAGEGWHLLVRLSAPHGNANPHGFDRERWLWENGIGATGYVRNGPRDPLPQRLTGQGWYPLEALRQTVGERITGRVNDPRSSGVLAALVVGDQSAIERSDWALFRTTGVAHLMSISGLHITMFAWLAIWLVGGLWRQLAFVWPQALLAVPVPWAAGFGGVALAAAYALFSGWGVPSQRTVLMLAVVVGLRLLARQWPWPVVWLVAMAAVLLLDPWALLQPGFWLSFVAVAILFATDPGRRMRQEAAPFSEQEARTRSRRIKSAVLGMLREQSVVTVALAPLSLLLFGQFSLVSLVANLLAIPWVTLVVTPLAMLGVAVPAFWDLAALAIQGLGGWLAWLAQWPSAAVFRPIPPLPLAFAGVVGGALLVMRWPSATRLVGLVLLWPVLSWQPPRPAAGEFDVMAMDVGQGSAVLVRTAGHSLLYDTGPRYSATSDSGQRVVVPLLRALGERPDTVVVSHRDIDHSGGSAAVQTEWPEARWLSSFDGHPARRCMAGQRWSWDGVDFEILHPSPEDFGPDGVGRLTSNAMSCVLRVGHASQSVWLSGDLDADRETRLALARPDLRASLLLAPHHGSLTSSSPVLLNTLAPEWVLVQAGYRNRFNHPAPAVLERYRQRGIRWVTTPDCGAATWRSDEPGRVFCQRESARRYWHHRGKENPQIEPESAQEPPPRRNHGSATLY